VGTADAPNPDSSQYSRKSGFAHTLLKNESAKLCHGRKEEAKESYIILDRYNNEEWLFELKLFCTLNLMKTN
jgi:hypothetical protein